MGGFCSYVSSTVREIRHASAACQLPGAEWPVALTAGQLGGAMPLPIASLLSSWTTSCMDGPGAT